MASEASGGMAAARNPAAMASAEAMTIPAAAQREMRCLTSQPTMGSRPTAMKAASPMMISTDRARITSSTRP